MDSDTALVWVLPNGESPTYDLAMYSGAAGLAMIEKGLGVAFPARVKAATFPSNSTAALTALLGGKQQATCGIERSTWKSGAVTPSQLAAWGPWNVIYADASSAELPSFPCPSTS